MNSQEIIAAINADAQLLALAQAGNTQAVADALTGTTTTVVETNGGIGIVLEALGPVAGATVLETLDAMRAVNPAVKWAFYLIERGGLNFGSPNVRGMIDQLTAGGAWSQEVGAALKSIAEQPVTVTDRDVCMAIYTDDGEVKI